MTSLSAFQSDSYFVLYCVWESSMDSDTMRKVLLNFEALICVSDRGLKVIERDKRVIRFLIMVHDTAKTNL